MADPQQAEPAAGKWRRELRNHPVIRVGGAYCVVAWLLMQIGEIVLPSFDAPAWIMQTLIAALVAGLPVVLVLARFTRLPSLVGLAEPVPSPVQFQVRPDPVQEAGDILRLKSASLAVPMDLSESRQVTTLVVSLQGLLRGREDPETLLGFVASIEQDIAQAVAGYEGTRMPSGRNEIVVAFGFPLAHEDDARRAARLSQELLELVRTHDIADGPDTRVISRAGLHSSTIIIDEGAGDADVMSLLGDTVSVAAFLQAAAAEGETAISEDTRTLLRAGFYVDEVARQSHPRLGQGVAVYQLGRELTADLANVMADHGQLFGREHERSLVMQQWHTVLEGESEYVLIKGEPGMGKTSLLFDVVRELMVQDKAQLMLLTCEPYYRESPFRPLLNFFESSVFQGERLNPAQRLERLQDFVGNVLKDGDEEAVPLLAALLSNGDDELGLATDNSSKRVREKTLALLVSLMERFSARKPLVLAVEDLHWADPSTRDLIESLLAYDPSTPIFGLFTARPEFEPSWVNLPDVIELNLNKLPARVAGDLVQRQAGENALPEPLVQQIVEHAGGIPLYLEQLTRNLLESREAGAGEEGLSIPATLKASLAARIDHLGAAKPLLQLCSVIGFEFSYELLRAVCADSDEKLLRRVLSAIVNAGLIYQKGAFPEATFKFKHRLIMEVASQSLLRRTRQRLHQAIADKLESDFPHICQQQPMLVAHHCSRAGNAPCAISYWIRAAQLSQAKFANEEAVAQVQRGLASLKDVPDAEQRNQYEITLQNLMGMIRLATQGYTNPEVRVAFERALELSDKVEQTPALFKMIVGLWMYYLIRGEYDRALELADQLLRLAAAIDEPPEWLQANYCAGYSHYYRGQIPTTLEYFQRALSYMDADADFSRQTPSRDDTRPHLLCMHALALWSHGDPQAADDHLARALSWARRHGQPYCLVWVLFFSTWLQHMRGKKDEAALYAGELIDICQARGFSFFIPLGLFFRAAVLEDPAERLACMREYLGVALAAGARSGCAYLRAAIVAELIDQQQLAEADALASENAAYIDAQGEWLYSSENQRMQARIALLREGNAQRSEALLIDAINQAREVNNLPFALTCALSLYELPGCTAKARRLIDALLARFASADSSEDYQRALAIVNEGTKHGLSA
ncbi:AAA family ATPase [Parahaliea mediterranea]|uniref:AAA family ATPase n=1 Tax=Parahaliea mediterranea TaxID=651086 RepID=UPI000E2F5C3C|nr:AAA family ATPase [Parahaliea mediterranea]